MDIHAWQHGAMNRSNKTAAIMVKDECVVADAGRVAIVMLLCVLYSYSMSRRRELVRASVFGLIESSF